MGGIDSSLCVLAKSQDLLDEVTENSIIISQGTLVEVLQQFLHLSSLRFVSLCSFQSFSNWVLSRLDIISRVVFSSFVEDFVVVLYSSP